MLMYQCKITDEGLKNNKTDHRRKIQFSNLYYRKCVTIGTENLCGEASRDKLCNHWEEDYERLEISG